MKPASGNTDPKWPEIAAGPDRRGVKAAVFPVVVDRGERCYGISIDQRWLCGSRGEPTCFDTIAAASRFLQLVKLPVHGLVFAPPQAIAARPNDAIQCFHLTRQGLASCCRCPVGQRNHAREAREAACQDDRW